MNARQAHDRLVSVFAAALSLVATVAHADGDTARRVLVMELQQAGTLPPDTARTVTGFIAAELARSPELFIVSSEEVDLIAQLGDDAQQCTDVACLAEVAGALGVSYLITGTISATDPGTVVQLRLIDAQKAMVVNQAEVRASTLEDVSALLPATLATLCKPLVTLSNPPAPAPPPAATPAAATREVNGESSISGLLIAGLSVIGSGAIVGAIALGVGVYAGGQLAAEDVPRDAKDSWLWIGRSAVISGLACSGLLLGAGSLCTLCSWME